MFFRTYLLDRESDYILAGDEVVVPKAGKSTYGLSRFFSSLSDKAIPGLSFLVVSLVSVNRKRSYSMVMEQIVRGTPSSNQGVCASEHQANTETATPKHKILLLLNKSLNIWDQSVLFTKRNKN